MLSTHYDHHEVEKGKYENWKNKGYFLSGDLTKTKFSMVIPPPNVTGMLHLGHAWNTTIQDIIARYKKAKGYDVLWVPGMDHAGIATQAKVEQRLRKEGISRYDLGREKFLEQAWKWKKEYAETIHKQWAMMGLSLDYSKERFTLDEGLSKAVKHVFVSLYNEGLIYRGEKIINWDPVFKTALSNIEVIHQDDEGEFFYFKYPLVNSNEYLTVATTRPETMFGDVCVVVNPKDDRYKHLVGQKVINPANHEEIVIIADDYVDIEFGTGAMKCTPAHDPNDFIIGQKYNLPHPIVINDDATMASCCNEYAGLDRYECRKKLVEKINQEGNLIKIEKIVHQVGHSERSGAVVEPMLKKQWFVKMKPLADASLKNQECDDKVEFIPERFNKIFTNWMENCEDWCISRQLWWGHRIPAYYNKKTGEILVSETEPKNMEDYYQDEDVLDTWFSSALWPFSTLSWPDDSKMLERYYPLDVMVTAYDIIFFWVSRMIFQGLHFMKKRPFDKCLIHGLIRDEQGRKMSKSLGNGIDPVDVINEYGVDALRYFLTTSTTPGLDTRFSIEKVKASEAYLNKIWNASRFILMNIENDTLDENIDVNQLDLIDKFILSRLNHCIQNVTENMEKYDFSNASTHLYNFVYDDFTSWYLELSKVKFSSENNINTKKVLLKVLKAIILMIYPYTPFIAEEIYLSLPNHKESIMLESYPKVDNYLFDEQAEIEISCLIQMIKDIRVFKVNNNMSPNAKIKLYLYGDFDFSLITPYLARFTFAEDIYINQGDKKNLASIYKIGQMYIEEDISKEELLKKIESKITFLNNEIVRCDKMLSNPNFVNKAPKEKVECEQNKLNEFKKQLNEYLQKKNSLN